MPIDYISPIQPTPLAASLVARAYQQLEDQEREPARSHDFPESQDKHLLDKGGITHTQKPTLDNAMAFQRAFSTMKGHRQCNLTPISITHKVDMVCYDNGSSHFEGLMTCNNAMCMVCSRRIANERAAETKKALIMAQNKGYNLYLLTLTQSKKGTLKERVELSQRVWNKLNNTMKQYYKRKGIELYYSRGLDLTIDTTKDLSFHPHIHAIIITNKPINDLDKEVWRRYKKLMREEGKLVLYSGFDMRRINTIGGIERYITKSINKVNNIAYEILSANKKGKMKSKTFYQFVNDICLNPTEQEIKTYKHITREMKGFRWYSESLNMKDLREEYNNTYKEEEDSPIEVYRTSIGINLWTAITELDIAYKVKSIMVDCKVHNKNKETWDQIEQLIKTSHSPAVMVDSIIEDYKIQLRNILRI